MKYVRWLAAWTLFYIGDAVSKLLNVLPQSDRWEWLSVGICAIYNRAMGWSHIVQGPGDFGPWYATDEQP
jgi:hypothetical protein